MAVSIFATCPTIQLRDKLRDWVENRDDARMNKPIRDEELVKRIGIEYLPGISPSAGGGTISGSREGATDAAVAECGNQRTCKQMSDCAEARHSLNDCGVASLDRKGDGKSCKALCRYSHPSTGTTKLQSTHRTVNHHPKVTRHQHRIFSS